jgi:GNAT superfamily N-acetyltransferase
MLQEFSFLCLQLAPKPLPCPATMFSPKPILIRPIHPDNDREMELVAERMRATLAEVIGEEGYNMYTLEWLRDRVRWHLSGDECVGRVLLALDSAGAIMGHMIARVEDASTTTPVGLISTIYVCPPFRRRGVAKALLDAGEAWLRDQRVATLATDTSESNQPLIELVVRRGYAITFHSIEKRMVRLSRSV